MLKKKVLFGIAIFIYLAGLALVLAILFVWKPYQSGLPIIPSYAYTASQCVDKGCNVTGTLKGSTEDVYPMFSWDRYNVTFMTEQVNDICVNQDNLTDCEDIYDARFSFCCVTLIGLRNIDSNTGNTSYQVTIHTVSDPTPCQCSVTVTGAWVAIGLVLIVFTLVGTIFCCCGCCQKGQGFMKLGESPRDTQLPQWSDETGWSFPEKKKCVIL